VKFNDATFIYYWQLR